MKKVEVKYTPHRVCGCDPLAMKNTIAVSGEIDGKKYGCFLELEDEETTVENVVLVIQCFLNRLVEVEEQEKQRNNPRKGLNIKNGGNPNENRKRESGNEV